MNNKASTTFSGHRGGASKGPWHIGQAGEGKGRGPPGALQASRGRLRQPGPSRKNETPRIREGPGNPRDAPAKALAKALGHDAPWPPQDPPHGPPRPPKALCLASRQGPSSRLTGRRLCPGGPFGNTATSDPIQRRARQDSPPNPRTLEGARQTSKGGFGDISENMAKGRPGTRLSSNQAFGFQRFRNPARRTGPAFPAKACRRDPPNRVPGFWEAAWAGSGPRSL
jgi:hypothetical protein